LSLVALVIMKKYFVFITLFLALGLFFFSCGNQENVLDKILSSDSELFRDVVNQQDKYKPQIIYTRIDRDQTGKPHFTRIEWGEFMGSYFYPASTIKLPTAVLSLQKLNEVNYQDLSIYSEMHTDSIYEWQSSSRINPQLPNFQANIASYVDQIFGISDNQAYNRLYEFCTADYLRKELKKRGYQETAIIHRLSGGLGAEENRISNPISFYHNDSILYHQHEFKSAAHETTENIKLGRGYIKNGELVDDAFDFSNKNQFSLSDQHEFLKNLIFQNTIEHDKRFNIKQSDYEFLLKSMASYPSEIKAELLDEQEEYGDNYVKFLMFGSNRNQIPESIRIFNKSGFAYGFLIDNAYIVDFENNVEFLLSAVIYVNENQIFNDDNYEYDAIGLPFLQQLGQKVYEYEIAREKSYPVDLSKLASLFKD